jgi:Uma2 family endonuclease
MSSPGNADKELPPVDQRLVAPESGYEIDDGKLVYVPPSDPPHATRHSKVTALLEAHVAAEYEAAVDMLTRTSELSDRAPDCSVFPRAPDPVTGGRQIEELAFEIMSTETRGKAAEKARDLAARGVRRIFAIDVGHERAFEWSRTLEDWSILDLHDSITDPVLAVPLPLEPLVRAMRTDDAVARALRAKRHPEFLLEREEGRAQGREEGREEGRAQGREEGRAEGKAEGLATALLAVLASRGLTPTADQRQRILSESDPARLERWLTAVASCATIDQVIERE